MMAFFSSVAKNGAAMIPLDECGGYPEMRFQGGGMPDAAHMPMFDMRDPSVQNKLSELAEELHFLGTKLLLKTELTYPEGYSLHGGEIFEFLKGTTRQTRPIPEEKMQEMVDQFVKKVSLYRSLGYDGLTIRTDGYVGWQPKERQDAYGGSVTNRTRLLHRCLSAVKQALGQDFLIEAVMAGELPLGYGGDFDAQVDALGNKIRTAQPKGSYQLEDTLEFLRAFDGIVDVLQLREHDAFLAQPTTYNYTGTPGTVSCAKAIRQSGFRGIIALNGGFQAPGQIEQLLENGVCDMIAMGRAFYADPDYYEKIRQDRAQDIVPCIKCNRCHGLVARPLDQRLLRQSHAGHAAQAGTSGGSDHKEKACCRHRRRTGRYGSRNGRSQARSFGYAVRKGKPSGRSASPCGLFLLQMAAEGLSAVAGTAA